MKKLIAGLCACLLVVLLAAPVWAAPKHVIRFATAIEPDSHYANGMRYFKERLEAATKGEVEVQLFYSGQLGGERDMFEGLGMGTLEMTITSSAPLINFSPSFKVFDLPFIVTDREKAFKVFDGPIGREILDSADKSGVRALGFWENGFRNITNSKRPILKPADLQGIKIRTMENPIHMKLFETLGAFPTPMAWGELFLALQQGTVDGQENPLIIIQTSKYSEVQKYLTLSGHVYAPAVVSIGKQYFESLPPEIQAAVVKSEEEARIWEREFCIQKDQELADILAKEGFEIATIDKAEWIKATQPVYEFFKDEINPAYIKALTE